MQDSGLFRPCRFANRYSGDQRPGELFAAGRPASRYAGGSPNDSRSGTSLRKRHPGRNRYSENLKYTGNDDVWLKKQLEAQHVTRIGDVFLATVNAQNELAVYPRTGERVAHEMFE